MNIPDPPGPLKLLSCRSSASRCVLDPIISARNTAAMSVILLFAKFKCSTPELVAIYEQISLIDVKLKLHFSRLSLDMQVEFSRRLLIV